LEIDYPDQLLFLVPSSLEQRNDFDTVGLVLDTNSAGQLFVRAVSSSASALTRKNILPGDIIVQLKGFDRAPYTLTEASRALSGAVGEHKELLILRQGKSMTVTVDVSRIL
jgi:C-terminal processing protease CtpA/Prc